MARVTDDGRNQSFFLFLVSGTSSPYLFHSGLELYYRDGPTDTTESLLCSPSESQSDVWFSRFHHTIFFTTYCKQLDLEIEIHARNVMEN